MAKKYPEVFEYPDKSSNKLAVKEQRYIDVHVVLAALSGINIGLSVFIAFKVMLGM